MPKPTSVLISLAIIVLGLVYFSEIIFPLIFATVGCLTLAPWVRSLKKKMPDILGVFIGLLTPMSVIILLGFGYYLAISGVISDLPDLSDQANEIVDDAGDSVESTIGMNVPSFQEMKRQSKDLLVSGSSILTDTFSAFSGLLSFLALIPVYMFFILRSEQNWIRFLQMRFDPYRAQREMVKLKLCSEKLLAYYKGLSIIIIIVAIMNTAGLYLIGVPHSITLGTFSALLIVIPYVGVFIGGVLPVIIAIVTGETYATGLYVIGWYALVQFLEGNIITPKLLGNMVDLNPLSLIVFMLIGGSVGGILGIFLAAPILLVIKVYLSYSSGYRSWSSLLGN